MPRQSRPRKKVVIRYYTPDGRRCTKATPGAKSRREETDAWYGFVGGRLVNLGTTDEGLAWQELRRRLRLRRDREAGIASPEQDDAARPLTDHLDAYLDHRRAKGTGADRLARVRQLVGAILEGTGTRRFGDLDAARVAGLLSRWQTTPGRGKGEASMGGQTAGNYIAAARAFAAWLARKLRQANPLAELSRAGARADRRHIRRPLTPEEFARLLIAAEAGGTYRGLSGPDRAVLYLVAAYTGLRASALASLEVSSLSLSTDPPTLVVSAGADKSRRDRLWPLHPEVAARLAAWLRGRTGRLWPGSWAKRCRASELIRRDLLAAGVPYRDERGRVADFHSLRTTFISNLARAGVPLAAAQKLAGHASPVVTAQHYIILETDDLAREVAKLPPPPPKAQE
ncbi:MAG TPA: tyrosine-type recombinase/integrase [Tepidisphaeraceae bacterium]|nr:tyrosine-type recombinase/integrase [Tepidisphaeraceae bacterium]